MQPTTTTTTAATAAEGDAADESFQFSRLPQALLTRILQLLPQRERLASCTLVCKSWAEAAATVRADASFSKFAERPRRISVFGPWLEQHAGQLVSLKVRARYKAAPFHLPFSKLQQLSRLDLEGVKVLENPAAGSSSSNTGAAPGLGKLRELKLHRCKFSHDALLQLAQLSGVAKFELDLSPDLHGGLSTQPKDLKCLLHGMSNLGCLYFGHADTADIMPALPARSLTALTMHWSKLPDSASRLVNLRELKLSAEPSLETLAGMTMVTKLELDDCQPAAGVNGTISGFLAALRGMCQLQHRGVYDSFLSKALLQTAHPRACAALTASSQLTCLDIYSWRGQPLPASALQRMFPAGKQLPRLKYIGFRSHSDRRDIDAGRITTAELSSLVEACPALVISDLTCVLAPDADVSTLRKLPQHCQHLGVGGQVFGDEAAGVVAQLTQLITLEWSGSPCLGGPSLTYAGLARLTALHTLETLSVHEANLSGASKYACDSVSLKGKAGGQSVSQQLCELLLAAPGSGPWKQQLLEQQNRVANVQDRLEQQEQQEDITAVQDSLRELSCST